MSPVKFWVQLGSTACNSVNITEEADVEDLLNEIRTNFDHYSKDKRPDLVLYGKRKRDNEDIDDVFSPDMKVKTIIKEKNYPGSCCSNPIYIKRQKQENIWIPFKIRRSNATCGDLHLVSRQDTFKALREIHQKTFSRRKKGNGVSWIIPLMDNLHGMGKSAFALDYINMYQDFQDETICKSFLKEIKQTRTIYVNLFTYSFNFVDFEKTLVSILCAEFLNNFNDYAPFSQEYFDDSMSFLKAVINYAGPVFIVFDGIGEIFKWETSSSEANSMFWYLVKHVFKNWCNVDKLYFVFIGCTPYVRSFASEEVGLPYIIERLPLAPLNPESIAEVIRHTRKTERREKKLYEYYNLDEEKLKLLSEKLFYCTNGVPRELSNYFCTMNNYEGLMSNEPRLPHGSWESFSSFVSKYRQEIDYLLQNCIRKTKIDISKEITKPTKDSAYVTQNTLLHEIATRAGFEWTGETRSALLHISEPKKHFFLNSGKSFREFLENYGRMLIETPKYWQWTCRRRLIEVLRSSNLERILPHFLRTPFFGSISCFKISDIMVSVPKVTEEGLKCAEMNNDAIHPDYFPILLQRYFEMSPKTLVPLPDSKSLDTIMSTAVFYQGGMRDLVLGLSIKDCNEELTSSLLDREYQLFLNCFQSPKHDKFLKVLMVFCTNCSEELEEKLETNFFYCPEIENSKVNEVILLNLMSKQKRDGFFGVKDKHVSNVIERFFQ